VVASEKSDVGRTETIRHRRERKPMKATVVAGHATATATTAGNA